MKTKLIQTKDYLLLIDEEAEVCRGQYRLLNDKVELIHEGHNYPYKGFKIIAYYPLNEEVKELDLPWLPNLFNKTIDSHILELAEEYVKSSVYHSLEKDDQVFDAFIKGYKASQSNKQFSLEDMKKAIEMAQTPIETGIGNYYPNISEIIQSLSTQQLPKEFIPKYEYQTREGEWKTVLLPSEWFGTDEGDNPKRLKTIINSEGRKEIQGTYKY